jgi:hypothetical protein
LRSGSTTGLQGTRGDNAKPALSIDASRVRIWREPDLDPGTLIDDPILYGLSINAQAAILSDAAGQILLGNCATRGGRE